MKRLALLLLLVPAFAAACGGSSDSGDPGLAEAPTAAPSEAPSEAAPAPTPPAEPAAPQGEEVSEQRGIGGVEEDPVTEPAEAEPAPAEPGEAPAREEDTSRPEAPIITGNDLDGNPLSIADFKGKPVVVKVFAEH